MICRIGLISGFFGIISEERYAIYEWLGLIFVRWKGFLNVDC